MESLKTSVTSLPDLYAFVINGSLLPIPEPPADLVEFRTFNKYEKEKISEKFHGQEHIKAYLEDKWLAEQRNRDLFLAMWEVWRGETDHVRRHALETKMTLVKRSIIGQQHKFWGLCVNWKAYVFPEQKQKSDQIVWNA